MRLTLHEFDLQAELGQVLWAATRTAAELADTRAAHRGVLAAIEARDPELARARTEAHVDAVTHRLVALHIALTRRDGMIGP